MTRAETDRSLLRAFGEAARLILENATPRRAESRYLTHVDLANRRPWVEVDPGCPVGGSCCETRHRLPRRQRVHARNVAHALATAWGL